MEVLVFSQPPSPLAITAAVLGAFLVGALPFSVWIARLALGRDLRQVADGNPGASNVARIGGLAWGAFALALDLLKGAIPAYLVYFQLGWRPALVVPLALAPVFGHAFSPFLRWHGGKALATTIGVWAGLTLGEAPLVMGLFFVLSELLLDVDGWAVLLGMLGLLAHLLLNRPETTLLAVWFGNALLLAWTHRPDLRRRPSLRRWWRRPG